MGLPQPSKTNYKDQASLQSGQQDIFRNTMTILTQGQPVRLLWLPYPRLVYLVPQHIPLERSRAGGEGDNRGRDG